MSYLHSFIAILVSVLGFQSCNGRRIFSFQMHHRYSEPVKKWSEKSSKGFPVDNWPVKGSAEYYAQLADRDRFIHGRKLSGKDGPLSFSDGNSTFQIGSLGFLHYTTVSLGTPGMKFLVALDTGSDLFWVPCECSKCAPIEGTTYASDYELSIYNPKESSSSKKVTCNSRLCSNRDRCLGTFSNCPYMISYISDETSTSGILVQDVLHLSTEDKLIGAYITFGCGQVQTGSFLDTAAPNGLFGLGMEKHSVPSILSSEGFMADSFSMCFGRDGIGRITFGDEGSTDQKETPFNVNPSRRTYNISVTQFRVGTMLIDKEFSALVDSGTSFTYLVDPTYTKLTESFHSQVQDRRRLPDSRIPFEYCYDMSPDANTSLIPSMRLTMKGGSQFDVFDPIIVIPSQSELLYCLAVIKNAELNIIGQNYMTGYRLVFDREKYVLGWKEFDCYDIEDAKTIPVNLHPNTVPPAYAVGLGNQSLPESAKQTRNNSQNSFALPSYLSYTSDLTWSGLLIIFFLLL